jgi:predicted membrane protein
MHQHQHSSKHKIWAAVFFIGIGSILLLNNLNLLPFALPEYIFSWKMLLIIIGTYQAVTGNFVAGLVISGIGLFFLFPELFDSPYLNFYTLWPGLLVFVGIIMLVKMISGPSKKKIFYNKKSNDSYMQYSAIFSGEKKQISSYDFKGGKITAIFGGAEIDLSNCHISKEKSIIDMNVLWGGVVLIVSKEWNVISEISPIMGGVHDTLEMPSSTYVDPAAELILRGTVIMGGIEIKRV